MYISGQSPIFTRVTCNDWSDSTTRKYVYRKKKSSFKNQSTPQYAQNLKKVLIFMNHVRRLRTHRQLKW